MATRRTRAFYSGRVQGVGFRAIVRRLARSWGATGFVRNLPDGRVELLAEGDVEAVEGLLAAIDRAFSGPNHGREAADEPPGSPRYPDFTID